MPTTSKILSGTVPPHSLALHECTGLFCKLPQPPQPPQTMLSHDFGL